MCTSDLSVGLIPINTGGGAHDSVAIRIVRVDRASLPYLQRHTDLPDAVGVARVRQGLITHREPRSAKCDGMLRYFRSLSPPVPGARGLPPITAGARARSAPRT